LGAFVCIAGALALLFNKWVVHIHDHVDPISATEDIHWLAFSIHLYESANGHLPPAALRSPDGKPLLSWRVLLLPYTDQNRLYERFKLDEPWDSPRNRELIQLMPRFYKPRGNRPSPPYTTFTQVIRGPGTPFERPGLRLEDFKSSAAYTFLLVESAEPVIWSKPDDLEYRPDGSLPRFGEIFRDGFFIASTVDGKTRRIPLSEDATILAGITGKQP
jgi:hypothetical protein